MRQLRYTVPLLLLLLAGCESSRQLNQTGQGAWDNVFGNTGLGSQQVSLAEVERLRTENQHILTELRQLKQENRQLREIASQPALDLGPPNQPETSAPGGEMPPGVQEVNPDGGPLQPTVTPALPKLDDPSSATSGSSHPRASQLVIDPVQTQILPAGTTEQQLIVVLLATDARGQLVTSPADLTIVANNAVATSDNPQLARWDLSQSQVREQMAENPASQRVRLELPWPASVQLPPAIELVVEYQQIDQPPLKAEFLLAGSTTSAQMDGGWSARDQVPPGGSAPSLARPLDRSRPVR